MDSNIDDLASRVEIKKAINKLANTPNDPNIVFETSGCPIHNRSDMETSSTTVSVSVSPDVPYSITNMSNRLYTNGKIFEKFDWTDKKARKSLVKMLSDNCTVIGPI